jgi:hypothetical protein
METNPNDIKDESLVNLRDEVEENDIKRKKYISLYQARTILSKIGTMEERRISNRQLKRMRKLGIKSI